MIDPALWLGPAIVAAVISGLVSLIVVQLNFRTERKAERLRRDEKVRDFQIALRAEITSDLTNMRRFDRAKLLQSVAEAMAVDPAYVPVIPRLSLNTIFEAVVSDIPILPAEVIAPVVEYERLRQALGQFVEDLRASSHKELSADRRLIAYADYVATYDLLETLAAGAISALNTSLDISKTGVVPSNYRGAEGAASSADLLS